MPDAVDDETLDEAVVVVAHQAEWASQAGQIVQELARVAERCRR